MIENIISVKLNETNLELLIIQDTKYYTYDRIKNNFY